jgi:transcriptional regulator with XRE-family HTH domain
MPNRYTDRERTMPTLDEVIQEGIDRDPSLAYELALAEAELRWAEHTAAIRESRGLTQAALGERSGMAQSAIARYERAGRTPTLATLWKLADALGATYVIGPDFYLAVVPEQKEPSLPVNGRPATAAAVLRGQTTPHLPDELMSPAPGQTDDSVRVPGESTGKEPASLQESSHKSGPGTGGKQQTRRARQINSSQRVSDYSGDSQSMRLAKTTKAP